MSINVPYKFSAFYQKRNENVKNVKSLAQKFDSVLCYAFEVETSPYSIFILLSTKCNIIAYM